MYWGFAWSCWHTIEHPHGADVLVDVWPVNTLSTANDLKVAALFWTGL
jgi:hypothetical protein